MWSGSPRGNGLPLVFRQELALSARFARTRRKESVIKMRSVGGGGEVDQIGLASPGGYASDVGSVLLGDRDIAADLLDQADELGN